MDVHDVFSPLKSIIVVCLSLKRWLEELVAISLLVEVVYRSLLRMNPYKFIRRYLFFSLALFC